jgi:Uri superfamily endonuclease
MLTAEDAKNTEKTLLFYKYVSYSIMRNKGTYIVLLESDTDKCITIGRHGALRLEKGIYAYVGSAFGPGGVPARIKHHRKLSTKPHWHMDYLRIHVQYIKSFYVISEQRCEHEWAQHLGSYDSASIPMKGFGSSDCNCQTHLFYFSDIKEIENCISKLPHTNNINQTGFEY